MQDFELGGGEQDDSSARKHAHACISVCAY